MIFKHEDTNEEHWKQNLKHWFVIFDCTCFSSHQLQISVLYRLYQQFFHSKLTRIIKILILRRIINLLKIQALFFHPIVTLQILPSKSIMFMWAKKSMKGPSFVLCTMCNRDISVALSFLLQ